ncbi:MAG: thiamine phosphate synthase [Acidobacteria bacterium]|nr:thiamine phosphate synthase [Acidobacteriota bacterium]
MAGHAGWPLLDLAKACLNGGARLLQVRAKHASGGAFLDMATAVAAVAREAGAAVVVNDRADIARLAGADGVHVGQEDLEPAAVRAIVGPEAIVGISTHTPEQLAAAVDAPVSYVAVGPVFATATKDSGYAALGLERVRAAAELSRARGLPLVAIGGITLDNAAQVLRAGAHSVAVISDLLRTGDPERRVREFMRRIVGSDGTTTRD